MTVTTQIPSRSAPPEWWLKQLESPEILHPMSTLSFQIPTDVNALPLTQVEWWHFNHKKLSSIEGPTW